MNDQPSPSQFKQFGAPPPGPSGLRHLSPWMKVLATGGLVATVSLYVLQVALPDRFRPSSVAGDAAGDTVWHEIEGMKDAKVDLERRTADATAQANAKAQADLLAMQKAVEARTASLEPVTTMAGMLDVFCGLAGVVTRMTSSQGWDHGSSDDLYHLSQRTGAATCGVGNNLRQGVTQSQIEAIRTAAAARGAPMTDGSLPGPTGTIQAVATAAALPAPRALPQTLDDVFAIAEPSRHWPWDYVLKARAYIRTLPQPVQDQFFASLDDRTGTAWDVLVDRVQAYQALPDAPLPVRAPEASPAPRSTVQAAAQPMPDTRQATISQGQLRIYSYSMPTAALDRINQGFDLHNGYPTAWYDRVAAYRQAHGG